MSAPPRAPSTAYTTQRPSGEIFGKIQKSCGPPYRAGLRLPAIGRIHSASVWYHMSGPDKEHARAHMTIAVPGATTQTLGLPDKRVQNSIWIMNAGTTTAHLMVPGE